MAQPLPFIAIGDAGVERCSLLIVHLDGPERADRQALRAAGFAIEEARDWPGDEVTRFHVLLVEFSGVARASMLAARLRAKRGVGRRILIALVNDATSAERRAAQDSGFDAILTSGCSARLQVATILKGLRRRPEYRCVLPRRRAA